MVYHTKQVQMPNRFYDVEALNNFLYFTMVQNKHYMVDGTGNFVYFFTLSTNAGANAIELNAFVLNTTTATTPNSRTLPAGATWVIPTVQAICPIKVLDQNLLPVSIQDPNYVMLKLLNTQDLKVWFYI